MTRDEAKAQGLKRYFTGKPCLKGHTVERLVSSATCCQCHQESQQTAESREKHATYYKANRTEIAAQQAAYAKANPEKIAEQNAAYRKANADTIAAKQRVYYQANAEKIAAYRQANRVELAAKKAAYAKANAEKIAAKTAAYRKANPHIRNALAAKRRAQKRQATPPWADFEAIKAIYDQAAFITRVTGESNHVDHIYPLISDEVCGLHVAANLQILTATDNIKKSNKLLLMPETP